MSGWINGFSLLFGGTNVLSRCGYSQCTVRSALARRWIVSRMVGLRVTCCHPGTQVEFITEEIQAGHRLDYSLSVATD